MNNMSADSAILLLMAEHKATIESQREEVQSLIQLSENQRTENGKLLERVASLQAEVAQLLSLIPPPEEEAPAADGEEAPLADG